MSFFKRRNLKNNATILLAVLSGCVLFFNSSGEKNSSIEVRAEKRDANAVAMYTVPSAEKVFINGVVTPEKNRNF